MAKEGKDMDKKLSSRNGSVAPEAKGKDYNGKSNSNRHQRFHGKRREPWSADGNLQPKYQPPVPKPRNKSFEKRVRGNQNWSGRRDEVTQAQRAEFGSALPQGSKKINLNHLLNFKLEPRGGQQHHGRTSNRGQWSTRNKWGSYKHTRYNKEQFLQANCQFVVKSNGDYKVHMLDADAIVDWDVVEQVRLLGHEVPSCPICLYPPSAAQITRCGHIFCWSCILHYLALSDKTWRKCPICYESVIKKDLKSVVATEQHLFKPGDEITMCLMKRQRGSVVSQPVYLGEDLEDVVNPYNILERKNKTCYVKLLTASLEEVKHLILSSERAALEKQLSDNDDELEGTFIRAALDSLKEREELLSGGIPSIKSEVKESPARPSKSASSASEEEEHFTISSAPSDEDYLVYASAFSDEEAEEQTREDTGGGGDNSESALAQTGASTDEDVKSKESFSGTVGESPILESLEPLSPGGLSSNDEVGKTRYPTTSESTEEESLAAAPSPKGRQSQKTHTYYFYQSDDGQPIFIHPLNVRCLVQQYGSLDKCPLTIKAKIVEMEHMSMTEDIRHRLRYMVHLPLTSNFSVCELDLKPPVLSEETISLFQDDFLKRNKARDRKLKEEKRRERRMQAEMDRSYGIYPSARYSLKSNHQFPSVGPSTVSDDQLTVSSGSGTSSPGPATPLSASVEEDMIFPVSADTIQQPQSPGSMSGTPPVPAVPSFAQMLREGQAKPGPHKKISAVQPSVETVKPGDGSDESENEDYIPVPQYQDAFSDAIQDALDKVTLNTLSSTKAGDAPVSSGGRKGKKGRKKQQLLFSTAGPRFK
ncbi:E3 ubiquitin-protein ligase RNF10-like isoform X3 [Apostichopus japonicus]|uniref:E3 ubiquitin-protein ligase RNF10-like isoform X3 n=1 Tax=Stichopus japonicus TaxID=307972 RepID=UPI003AB75614